MATVRAGTTNTMALVGKKKVFGASRLWMRFDRAGQSGLMECDKSVIIKRTSLRTRDLRILGPIFSHSWSILARKKAMVVNLEYIKAIVTAEEVLLLDPLRKEVLPFVDQLRRQLPYLNALKSGTELPFEFRVLEIALQVVCVFLDDSASDLERYAYPVLDELAVNVSTSNLEQVRSLKSNLTRLLARVQKVRDEIEHVLDDNEDMAQLCLARKPADSIVPHVQRLGSAITNDHDAEDLEMLLEAYFIQLNRTRDKILSVREYINDTEDCVNIQLDNQRNELLQLQVTLGIASLAIAVETALAGVFGMNIPCTLYNINGIFWPIVGGMTVFCIIMFFVILGYARWKKLL